MKKRILWLLTSVTTALLMAFNITITPGYVDISLGAPVLAHDCGECEWEVSIEDWFCDDIGGDHDECDSNNGGVCGLGSSSCC